MGVTTIARAGLVGLAIFVASAPQPWAQTRVAPQSAAEVKLYRRAARARGSAASPPPRAAHRKPIRGPRCKKRAIVESHI